MCRCCRIGAIVYQILPHFFVPSGVTDVLWPAEGSLSSISSPCDTVLITNQSSHLERFSSCYAFWFSLLAGHSLPSFPACSFPLLHSARMVDFIHGWQSIYFYTSASWCVSILMCQHHDLSASCWVSISGNGTDLHPLCVREFAPMRRGCFPTIAAGTAASCGFVQLLAGVLQVGASNHAWCSALLARWNNTPVDAPGGHYRISYTTVEYCFVMHCSFSEVWNMQFTVSNFATLKKYISHHDCLQPQKRSITSSAFSTAVRA